MVTGYDYNRLSMVLAVLEKRAGYYFSNCDTYINIVGGLRVDEPAIDLSIAMALISSLKDTPIDENAVVFGKDLRQCTSCLEICGECFRSFLRFA